MGWGGLVYDSKSDIDERLFAWSFRLAVASDLRWGDLLNTAPATLVLIKEGPIGFAAKTKTRGKYEGGGLAGGSNFAFSNENRLTGGFLLFPRKYWGFHPIFLDRPTSIYGIRK